MEENGYTQYFPEMMCGPFRSERVPGDSSREDPVIVGWQTVPR